MPNYTEQEEACRYFWESTLFVPMVLPTILEPAQIRQQIPMPARDIIAEPSDILTLKFNGDSEKRIQMYTESWMKSLDYLLYRYLTLVLHDPHYSASIRVPVEIRQEYQHYRTPSAKRQYKDKEFILPDYYQHPHNGGLDSSEDGEKYEYFKTDNPVAPAILNVFCHGLFPHAGKKKIRWSPHINAQLYKLDSCGNDTIPDFKPEDYIAYELITGLSLSVEITAILLEIDQDIRDLAFRFFYEHALTELVQIPFPYARATAARNFFLQVNLDWTKAKYAWSPTFSPETKIQIIEMAAMRALSCIRTLSSTPLHPQEPPLYPHSIINEPEADLTAVLQKLENDNDLKHVAEELRKAENNPAYPKTYRIVQDSINPEQFHIQSYMFPYYPISFPWTDDIVEIESYKKQIITNLKAVSSPLDWRKLFDPKPRNLAIFTNPNHKYVSLLMEFVEKGSLQTRGEKDPPPIKSNDCIDLFRLVFYVVRYASIETHPDIYQVKRFLKQM